MLLTNSSPNDLRVFSKFLIFCSIWLMSLRSNYFWICCSFLSFPWRFSPRCSAYLIRDRLKDANISFEISVVLGVRLLAIIWSLNRRWAIIDSWVMLRSTRSLLTGDIISLLIMWFNNFSSFFLFDSTVLVAMRERMNKRQDLTITDLYGHFSNVLFNIEVTNNLHPFLKTLTECRVISSHFQRPCTSLNAKNPIWASEIFNRLFEFERSICIKSYEVLTSDVKLGFTINSRSLWQIEIKS